MADVRVVTVPGRFEPAAAYVDIETRKVPADYYAENGEHFRRRWSVFMTGVARDGEIRIITDPDEREVLAKTADAVANGPVVYSATREFDEMVLKGRFTNARRAHASEPFYPALPNAERLDWLNIWPTIKVYRAGKVLPERGADIPSREIPEVWPELPLLVMAHNLRDVVELILLAGGPDAECRAWCERVLTDTAFAMEMVDDE